MGSTGVKQGQFGSIGVNWSQSWSIWVNQGQLGVIWGLLSLRLPYPPSPGWVLGGHGGSRCMLYRQLMSWRSHVPNFNSLWCQEPHQRHPYPPSPGWIFGGHGGSRSIIYRQCMSCRVHVSNFSSLWCQEPHQGHPCPPSPGWILGGHVCFIHTVELVLRNYTKLTPQTSKSIHCVQNSNV